MTAETRVTRRAHSRRILLARELAGAEADGYAEGAHQTFKIQKMIGVAESVHGSR